MKTIDLQTELTNAVPLMTRREKLFRWAELVRARPGPLYIFHEMETWTDSLTIPLYRADLPPNAFSIAAADPTFQAAGLQGSSARQAMDFFELTQQQLHEFSCDCGGHISNHDMADRITILA